MMRFASIVFDVDSTLSGVEGIDWLAALREPALAEEVRALTTRVMAGEIAIEEVFAKRLKAVGPSRSEVEMLGETYVARVAPDAQRVLADLQRAGVRVELVSAGLRPAVSMLATRLGVPDACVHAVDVRFDSRGRFAGFDEASPLARQHGKAEVVRSASLPRPILVVGDGSTDAVIKSEGAADAFAAFVGFVRRSAVVELADYVIESLAAVRELVLGE